jgi:hypothetical protein
VYVARGGPEFTLTYAGRVGASTPPEKQSCLKRDKKCAHNVSAHQKFDLRQWRQTCSRVNDLCVWGMSEWAMTSHRGFPHVGIPNPVTSASRTHVKYPLMSDFNKTGMHRKLSGCRLQRSVFVGCGHCSLFGVVLQLILIRNKKAFILFAIVFTSCRRSAHQKQRGNPCSSAPALSHPAALPKAFTTHRKNCFKREDTHKPLSQLLIQIITKRKKKCEGHYKD